METGAVIKPRKWWLAGLLSLIAPGLGQIYNGQIKKAILLLAAPLFLVPLQIYVLLNGITIALIISALLVTIGYSVGVIADAILVANKLNATYSLKKYNKWYVYILVFVVFEVIPSCLYYCVRHSCVQAFRFTSSSMEPTLLNGDYVLIDKRSPARNAQRGVLVVFEYPKDPSKHWLKRIVAVSGDKVEIRDKLLFVNDKQQTEPYVIHAEADVLPRALSPRDNFGPIVVPADSYFLLGDNRDHSNDSRFWGALDKSKIKGKAISIYWSWDKAKGKVRWERIGLKMQ